MIWPRNKNGLNIDKLRARVKCLRGENVIIPIKVKELYIASPENRKSIIIIETIHINRREPFPLFVIALKQKIIDNWILEKLIGSEQIAYTLTSYTNNKIIMQYLNHLIKHSKASLEKP
jgi:hypothetical protein